MSPAFEPSTSRKRSGTRAAASAGSPASAILDESTPAGSSTAPTTQLPTEPNASPRHSTFPLPSSFHANERALQHVEIDAMYGANLLLVRAMTVNDIWATHGSPDLNAADHLDHFLCLVGIGQWPQAPYHYAPMIAKYVTKRAVERMTSHLIFTEYGQPTLLPEEFLVREYHFNSELALLLGSNLTTIAREGYHVRCGRDMRPVIAGAELPTVQAAWTTVRDHLVTTMPVF